MGFLFTGLFWGVILILLGLSVIINIFLPGMHIPVFRIIIAVLLMYFGIRVLTGGSWGWRHFRGGTGDNSSFFNDSTVFDSTRSGEYNVVFGKGIVEAGSIFATDPGRRSLRVNTVFGNMLLRIPKDLPVQIRATSAFGAITMPDGSTSTFGETKYRNDAARLAADSAGVRTVYVKVVFGACRIEE